MEDLTDEVLRKLATRTAVKRSADFGKRIREFENKGFTIESRRIREEWRIFRKGIFDLEIRLKAFEAFWVAYRQDQTEERTE